MLIKVRWREQQRFIKITATTLECLLAGAFEKFEIPEPDRPTAKLYEATGTEVDADVFEELVMEPGDKGVFRLVLEKEESLLSSESSVLGSSSQDSNDTVILAGSPPTKRGQDVHEAKLVRTDSESRMFMLGAASENSRASAAPQLVAMNVPMPNDQGGLQSLLQSKAPQILEEHRKRGTLCTASRKLLVKVCVSQLVESHGFYPPSAAKLGLANSIITTFPSLRVQIEGRGDGHEHYYDPSSHSGFLEMRLRNVRRKLEEGQRRYSKRKSCDPEPGSEAQQNQGESSATQHNEWVTLVKRLRPSSENIPSIKSAMENTYTRRRAWITKDKPTIAEILDEYPRFVDVPSLLDIEFGRMTDGKTDQFIRKWEASIMPKLKAVAAMENSDLASLMEGIEDQTDDEKCHTMLVVLTHLLPPLPRSRCSVKSAISFLLDCVPPGTSIASLCTSEPEKTQPMLVCIGDWKTTRQYVIVARNDNVTIPLDDGLTCALDKLFKLYWVANVSYPPQLSAVYTFFEHVYDLKSSSKQRAKVLDLIAKLQAAHTSDKE